MRQHNWPPQFKPAIDKEFAAAAKSRQAAANASAAREVAAATGTGWGLGSIYGISDAADKRVATVKKPDWMGASK